MGNGNGNGWNHDGVGGFNVNKISLILLLVFTTRKLFCVFSRSYIPLQWVFWILLLSIAVCKPCQNCTHPLIYLFYANWLACPAWPWGYIIKILCHIKHASIEIFMEKIDSKTLKDRNWPKFIQSQIYCNCSDLWKYCSISDLIS